MIIIQPERRLEIYRAMFKYINGYKAAYGAVYPCGFCYALKHVKTKSEPPMFNNLSKYPELHKIKPVDRPSEFKRSGYWFERGTPHGVQIRLDLLTTIIKQMSNDTV